MEEEPHGLRWEMNELVVSFHNPDLQNDQVLYCRMGTGDRTLLETIFVVVDQLHSLHVHLVIEGRR